MSTYIVKTSQELTLAFNKARAGDRIELAPGTYSAATLANHSFAQDVTITSQDSNNRAVFTDDVELRNVDGVAITGIDVTSASLDSTPGTGLLFVRDSSHVTLTDMHVTGHIPTASEGVDPTTATRLQAITGYGYGIGVRFLNSSDVKMTDVEITDFRIAADIGGVTNTTLTNVDIHGVREGVDLHDVTNTVITDSSFHDFAPWLLGASADHPDMIQYWGLNSTSGIHGLTITDNDFYQPNGSWTQTIFGHMTRAKSGVTATDFVITGNRIVNGHVNAIDISDVTNLTISDNLLLPNTPTPTKELDYPQIVLYRDTNVDIGNNVMVTSRLHTDYLGGGDVNVTTHGNLQLSRNPLSPTYWGGNLYAALSVPDLATTPTTYLQDVNAILTGTGGSTGGTGGSTGGTGGSTGGTGGSTTTLLAVIGDDNDNTLRAGKTDSYLSGGDGSDFLYEGSGSDVMNGGAGADRFVFDYRSANGTPEVDIIEDLDFSQGDDFLMIGNTKGLFDDSIDKTNYLQTGDGSAAKFNSLADIAEALAGNAITASALSASGGVILSPTDAPEQQLAILTIDMYDWVGVNG